MTLCNCCTKLLDNANWRKYILSNHSCMFCDVPYHIAEFSFIDKLEVGKKATICGIPFIKVDNDSLLNLSRLYQSENI